MTLFRTGHTLFVSTDKQTVRLYGGGDNEGGFFSDMLVFSISDILAASH